jgi:hypothetical protein
MYSSAHGEPKDRGLDWASVQECLLDGPARAVRCGRAIIGAVLPLGLDVRAGVHTGSGLVFEDAGVHELKGIPEQWHLYRVLDGAS